MVQEIGWCCFRFLSGNAFLPWFRFPIFLGGVCNQTPEENRNISMFECEFSNVPIIFEWLFHLLLTAQQLRFMVQRKLRWIVYTRNGRLRAFLYKFGVLKRGWDHHIAERTWFRLEVIQVMRRCIISNVTRRISHYKKLVDHKGTLSVKYDHFWPS